MLAKWIDFSLNVKKILVDFSLVFLFKCFFVVVRLRHLYNICAARFISFATHIFKMSCPSRNYASVANMLICFAILFLPNIDELQVSVCTFVNGPLNGKIDSLELISLTRFNSFPCTTTLRVNFVTFYVQHAFTNHLKNDSLLLIFKLLVHIYSYHFCLLQYFLFFFHLSISFNQPLVNYIFFNKNLI